MLESLRYAAQRIVLVTLASAWLAAAAMAGLADAQTVFNPSILPPLASTQDLFTKTGLTPNNVYSLRRIYSTYTGQALRLQRASDSTQKDFGFAAPGLNALVDTTGISSFCAATTCTVVIWYDQSPNANNAITPYADSPIPSGPQIVLNCNATLPCISFAGSNGLQAVSPINGTFYLTSLTVGKFPASTGNMANWIFCCGQTQTITFGGDQFTTSNFAGNGGTGSLRYFNLYGAWSSLAQSTTAAEEFTLVNELPTNSV